MPDLTRASKRARRGLHWLCGALLCLAWPMAASAVGPEQPSLAQTARLEALAKLVAERPDSAAPELIAAASLADLVHLTDLAGVAPEWSPLPFGPVDAQAQNMRLSLTMVTQAYGGEDVMSVLTAQTAPNRPALVLRSGTASLADLRAGLASTGLQAASGTGPLTLSVPLVIGAGAALRLAPGEVLNLSRPDGAYVMNFGLLQVDGAAIATVGDVNPRRTSFVPFVTTADGGAMQALNARFAGLGFGPTPKFSGVAILQGTIRAARQPSWIQRSHFADIMSVSVSLAPDVILRGNRFRDMRGAALVVSQSRRAQVLLNLFSGGMKTNAILIEHGSTGARVAGNVIVGGKRAGIVVRSDSKGATIEHNIVWRRLGGGIAVLKSDCAEVAENLVLRNRQKGIEVRSSLGAQVYGNTILANNSAGIWVSAQQANTTTRLRDNDLAENGSGIAGAVAERLQLAGNDFSHQFPQFLSGDLALQSAHIARNMRGEKTIVLTAAGPVEPTAESDICAK